LNGLVLSYACPEAPTEKAVKIVKEVSPFPKCRAQFQISIDLLASTGVNYAAPRSCN